MCLGFVKEARNKGLQAPVILDEQALRGFRACTEEGIIPALETAHAVWATIELAKTMPKDAIGAFVSLRGGCC
jgi:tryptophan synthase beta subunit